jgi:hypothetical protein
MRIFGFLAALLLVTVSQAGATTYDPFSVSGTFTDPFKDTFSLSGSLDVDTSSGQLTNVSLTVAGEPWTQIVSQGSSGGFYDVSIQTPITNSGCTLPNGPGCHDTLSLVLSVSPLTLVQNNGGSILSGFANLEDAGFQIALESGSLSAIATPLPSSLPLFTAGLGVIGFFYIRRRRLAAGTSSLVLR